MAFKKKYTANILVVGGGVSGLSAFLRLKALGASVVLIAADDLLTPPGLGALNQLCHVCQIGDDEDQLVMDQMVFAGEGPRESWIRCLARHSPQVFQWLVRLGVSFESNLEGEPQVRLAQGARWPRALSHPQGLGRKVYQQLFFQLLRYGKPERDFYPRREFLKILRDRRGLAQGVAVLNRVTGAIEDYAAQVILFCGEGTRLTAAKKSHDQAFLPATLGRLMQQGYASYGLGLDQDHMGGGLVVNEKHQVNNDAVFVAGDLVAHRNGKFMLSDLHLLHHIVSGWFGADQSLQHCQAQDDEFICDESWFHTVTELVQERDLWLNSNGRWYVDEWHEEVAQVHQASDALGQNPTVFQGVAAQFKELHQRWDRVVLPDLGLKANHHLITAWRLKDELVVLQKIWSHRHLKPFANSSEDAATSYGGIQDEWLARMMAS